MALVTQDTNIGPSTADSHNTKRRQHLTIDHVLTLAWGRGGGSGLEPPVRNCAACRTWHDAQPLPESEIAWCIPAAVRSLQPPVCFDETATNHISHAILSIQKSSVGSRIAMSLTGKVQRLPIAVECGVTARSPHQLRRVSSSCAGQCMGNCHYASHASMHWSQHLSQSGGSSGNTGHQYMILDVSRTIATFCDNAM